jgi:hypothetical protein
VNKKNMLQTIKQKLRGSVLVFTLLALSVLLLGALSLATSTIVGQKNAKNTDTSMQAFQSADSGVERVLVKLKNAGTNDNIVNIWTGGQCVNVPGGQDYVTGTTRNDESTYKVQFFDAAGDPMDCSDRAQDVREIKSTGEFAGTTRAIKTAVAAGACGAGVGIIEVAKGSGSSFSPGDFNDVWDFIKPGGDAGSITSMSCHVDSPIDYVEQVNGLRPIINDSNGTASFYSSSGTMVCAKNGDCKSLGNQDCNGGWVITGECP